MYTIIETDRLDKIDLSFTDFFLLPFMDYLLYVRYYSEGLGYLSKQNTPRFLLQQSLNPSGGDNEQKQHIIIYHNKI